MAIQILHGAQSDIGRKRLQNEDRYCVDPTLGLYIVCDGMGGSNAGEVASALAIESIHRHINEVSQNPAIPLSGSWDPSASPATNRLASAIRLANELIYSESMTKPEWTGMGTTVVAALITDDLLSFAHVGDSRLYLLRQTTLQPLTLDHSWVAEQVRTGMMTEDEAERSPRRNIVTRALGVDRRVDVTLGETPLHPGDRVLLCSDGLTKGVRPAAILASLTRAEDMTTLSEDLIALANNAGGEDNTTVIVLSVSDAPEMNLWHQLRDRLAI
jgi:serine/threonine protein phosphatase PrpC